jgi:hypothetical protein
LTDPDEVNSKVSAEESNSDGHVEVVWTALQLIPAILMVALAYPEEYWLTVSVYLVFEPTAVLQFWMLIPTKIASGICRRSLFYLVFRLRLVL